MSFNTFRTIPNYEKYEINIKGDVRNKNTKNNLQHFKIGKIREYVILKNNNNEIKRCYIKKLLLEIFPEDNE